MRDLDRIDDFSDIYQPVPEADIEYVESQLGLQFPDTLKAIFRDPDLRLIKKLPTLLWIVRHPSLGLHEVNDYLRSREHDPFPDYLVAFATNECGDWFCFEIVNDFDFARGGVVYIDPSLTVEENLRQRELTFPSFDAWVKCKS